MPTRPRPDRPFAAVYFDCDSTLSAIEGVDELTGGGDEEVRRRVAALTREAMEGRRALDEVYAERLRLLQPHRAEVERVGRLYVERLVTGARALVRQLQGLGKAVGIVSGGLLPAVQALARHLGVDPALVHAVPLQFDAEGRYQDFDRASPLARNGGKVEVLRRLPASCRPLCFVGDGVTDLEAYDQVDWFVGFGGVARRAAVEAGADRFVAEPDLTLLLPHLLTPDELSRTGG